jgi:hypothetical protein
VSDTVTHADVGPPAQARRAGWRGPAIIAVLVVAGAGLVVWYALQRETPAIVVQRFCSALKGKRWEQAYALIDWPAENRMAEKTFVQMGKALSSVVTIQKYKLGEPRRDGDTAIVPVTATVSVMSFSGTQERTDDIDIRCRFANGEWKVRPDLKQGFLGLGKGIIPGVK